MMMHGNYGGWHPGFGFFGMPFIGILFWIVIILLAVYLTVLIIRRLKNNGTHYKSPDSDRELDDPVSIAKKRYARGEISKQEYEQLLRDLE
ncbi:MAG: SHOCT domain-containing protein [Spirochaetota bacterium]